MMPISDDDRERCEAYFDGELPTEKEAEFRAWLRADPEHVREFTKLAQLHRALRDELKGRGARREEASRAVAEAEYAGNPRRWRMWGAAAAVLLCAGYLLYRFAFTDPKLAVYAAKIETYSGQVFVVEENHTERTPAHDKTYLNGKVGLEIEGPGQAVLKYLDGTTLDFKVAAGSGALRLSRGEEKRVNSAKVGKRVTVENGLLSVDAAHQPEYAPLIIATPLAEITVIGTKFKLEVTAASTRLDVTEGKVRIARYSDSAGTDVSAAEYIMVTNQGPLLVQKAAAPPN